MGYPFREQTRQPAKYHVQYGSTDTDRNQIEKICRQNADMQGNLMENWLGTGIIRRNIEHISLTVSRSQNVDQRSKYTADKENRKCPDISFPA